MNNLDWLNKLEVRGSILGLDRIKELLKKLSNPEKNIKCIHIAGTNGKGSTCAILSSILKEAGYKVGMYTSPHLKKYNERFQINSVKISDKEFDELIAQVRPFVTKQTIFEVLTAMAFLYFKHVDYLVLEVGLGGRLDATNVITPVISIITNISLDHTQILGNSEDEIAMEKAGIIKENVPVITRTSGKSLKIVKSMASKLYIPKDQKVNLLGNFQKENASLAVQAATLLRIPKEAIHKGLQNVKWPGRMEFIGKNIFVDCAHNPAGMKKLKQEIKEFNYEKIISVIGIQMNKNEKDMIEQLDSFSDYIIFTKPNLDIFFDPKKLSKISKIRNEAISDSSKALKRAKNLANPNDLILITGSIYLVGEIR